VSELEFEVVNSPSGNFIRPLHSALSEYNRSHNAFSNIKPLGVCVKHPEGHTLGAIYGWLEWEWLFINLLWVDESMRGQGIGSELLKMLEQQAVKLGVTRAYLETGCFQAPEFYIKQGYKVITRMPIRSDDGHEFVKLTMHKARIA